MEQVYVNEDLAFSSPKKGEYDWKKIKSNKGREEKKRQQQQRQGRKRDGLAGRIAKKNEIWSDERKNITITKDSLWDQSKH